MFPDGFQTARLLLRQITPEDAAPIFDTYAGDAEVTRFLLWQPHRSIADTNAYISQCLATPPAAAQTYVIVGRTDRKLRGAFDLRRPVPHRLGFGYVLARAFWGQGLMTEALTEIVDWAFRQDAIWRIGDVCDVENLGSARVMEKAGLTREGLLRRWSVHPNLGDIPRDCFSYARTR